MSAVAEFQSVIEAAAKQVGPSVVGLGRGWQRGSGVVVADGKVLTAAHNLRGEEATVLFSGGRREPARVAGVDSQRDLAILEVATAGLPPIAFAEPAARAESGRAVIALANPGGRGLRATLGFVSAADRSFRGGRGRRVTGCIEHTAPLPRGASGSPLIDEQHRLLGLNAMRLEGGLILAVPAERRHVETLARGESTGKQRLGVAVVPAHVARQMRQAVGLPEHSGILVRSVEDSSPAARAGIAQGDLITGVAGEPLDDIDALSARLDRVEPGSTLALSTIRGAERREITVAFEEATR
jgi:serine protease Do